MNIICLFGFCFRLFLFWLERNDEYGQISALLYRRLVAGAVLGAAGGKSVQNIVAEILMLDLSASESDNNTHFVAVFQKLVGVIELCVEVVVSNNYGQLDLLCLRALLLFAGFLFFFDLVKTEFAVIHDPAHRRIRLRSYEDKVQISVVCKLFGLLRCDDTQRLSVLVYKTDGWQIDIIIYQSVVFSRADLRAPPGKFAIKKTG